MAERKAPPGLRARGRRFWDEITSAFELSEAEVETLVEAARTLDAVEALEAAIRRDGPVVEGRSGPRVHPAVGEVRQQRLVLAKLLASLNLPDEEILSPAQVRAKKAAESRWSRTERRPPRGA